MRAQLRRVRRSGLRGLTAILLLAVIAGAFAPDARAEGYAYDLAGELMSPFCPGRTLASCPSPQAAELIQWISLQEAAGVSREEVVEILIDRFGEEILGAPPAEGITLWAYVFPVAGFVLGGGIVALALHRLVRRGEAGVGAEAGHVPTGAVAASGVGSGLAAAPTPGGAAGGAADDELARLVDEELAGRDDR